MPSRSDGSVRRSTDPAAATTRSTGSRSTRPPSRACSTGRSSSCCTPRTGCRSGSAKNATDGFRYLVDEGCIGVAGAYSSDNAITVGPLANELQVPLISWCGTERLQGDYCFRLGNGDCGGDAALVVAWLKTHGPRTRRGAERDLAERRGVLPVLPPGVPAPRRQHRRGRDRQPEPREPRRRTSTTCARSSPTRSSTWATGCSPRRACCAKRSTSSAGIRRASWAPRSCSI